MATKIYISGNALKIEDTVTGKKLSRNKFDVNIFRDSTTSKIFVFLYVVGQYFVGNSDDFIKGDNTPFGSAAAFELWADENTGGSAVGNSPISVANQYSTNVISVERIDYDPLQQIFSHVFFCANLYIEFFGSGGIMNQEVVEDRHGRGFSSDYNLNYRTVLVAPPNGYILITKGVKFV